MSFNLIKININRINMGSLCGCNNEEGQSNETNVIYYKNIIGIFHLLVYSNSTKE